MVVGLEGRLSTRSVGVTLVLRAVVESPCLVAREWTPGRLRLKGRMLLGEVELVGVAVSVVSERAGLLTMG